MASRSTLVCHYGYWLRRAASDKWKTVDYEKTVVLGAPIIGRPRIECVRKFLYGFADRPFK